MLPATNAAHCEAQTGESYIRQAQAPVPVMKKSMAAPSTVAYVMQEKFQNGVPLYRQEAYWKSQGGRTAAQYHGQLGDPQRPLVQAVV